jgi:hypothetical protein
MKQQNFLENLRKPTAELQTSVALSQMVSTIEARFQIVQDFCMSESNGWQPQPSTMSL